MNMTNTNTITGRIIERGNGLAEVGDYVTEIRSGEVYLVVSVDSRIETAPSGSGLGNSVSATLELADWADVSDDNEPTCSVEIDDEDTFRATHEISVRGGAWGDRVVRVRDCDGVLYTQAEWDSATAADWTRDRDGLLLFQGRHPACDECEIRILDDQGRRSHGR